MRLLRAIAGLYERDGSERRLTVRHDAGRYDIVLWRWCAGPAGRADGGAWAGWAVRRHHQHDGRPAVGRARRSEPEQRRLQAAGHADPRRRAGQDAGHGLAASTTAWPRPAWSAAMRCWRWAAAWWATSPDSWRRPICAACRLSRRPPPCCPWSIQASAARSASTIPAART